jgi:hypothetical protein
MFDFNLSNDLGNLFNPKELMRTTILEDIKETFPYIDMSKVEVVINDIPNSKKLDIQINGLTNEQLAIFAKKE